MVWFHNSKSISCGQHPIIQHISWYLKEYLKYSHVWWELCLLTNRISTSRTSVVVSIDTPYGTQMTVSIGNICIHHWYYTIKYTRNVRSEGMKGVLSILPWWPSTPPLRTGDIQPALASVLDMFRTASLCGSSIWLVCFRQKQSKPEMFLSTTLVVGAMTAYGFLLIKWPISKYTYSVTDSHQTLSKCSIGM